MLEEVEVLQVAESGDTDVAPSGIDRIVNEGMTRRQALNLYTSHLLSTWNARTYEFAAVKYFLIFHQS